MVGEVIKSRSEFALTHSTPTRVIPNVALTSVMSDVERLRLRARMVVGKGEYSDGVT